MLRGRVREFFGIFYLNFVSLHDKQCECLSGDVVFRTVREKSKNHIIQAASAYGRNGPSPGAL